MNTILHVELAAGRWQGFSLAVQLAHIGSEVSRACKAKNKGNTAHMLSAVERMLELCSFTISDPKNKYRLRELCRMREILCDYFVGDNDYHSTSASFDRYFLQFALLAQTREKQLS